MGTVHEAATLHVRPIDTPYAMAHYLSPHVRGRSESVNTDSSSTVVSPFPTHLPNPKLTPLIGTKFPTNTILKSHGRPPWYFLDRPLRHHEALSMVWCRYGEDGQSVSPAFVIAIAGMQTLFGSSTSQASHSPQAGLPAERFADSG
jgi:hypothetical protein